MDLSVILKKSELDPKFQKYKGRVVLQVRGDVVEDDSGSCAVFTEPGSAASLMTAAKVMDCHGKTTKSCRTSS